MLVQIFKKNLHNHLFSQCCAVAPHRQHNMYKVNNNGGNGEWQHCGGSSTHVFGFNRHTAAAAAQKWKAQFLRYIYGMVVIDIYIQMYMYIRKWIFSFAEKNK